MHKIVDGITVECTEEEIKEIEADREKLRIKHENKMDRLRQAKEEKDLIIKKLADASGLTIEELSILLGRGKDGRL